MKRAKNNEESSKDSSHRTHRINIDAPAWWRLQHAQQGVQVGAAGDHLPAELVADALHDGGGGSHDVGVLQAQAFDALVQALAQQ